MPEEIEHCPAGEARRWLLAGALSAAVVLAAVIPSLPWGVNNWDNRVKLQVAWNMLRGMGPALTQHTPADELYVSPGKDGRLYASYPVLAPAPHLATIALASAGGPLIEGLPYALVLATVAWVLVAWARRSGASMSGAVAGSMLACLGTTLWPSAAFGYDVLVEVLALAVVLWTGSGEDSRRAWLLAGVAAGAAFAVRTGAGVLAIPAAAAIVAKAPRDRRTRLSRALAFAVGCAPGVLATLWFNQYRFGSPFTFTTGTIAFRGVETVVVPWFSMHHLEAIAGLVLSPGKGIFWYAPPLIGTAFLGAKLARRYPVPFWTLGAYAVAAVLLFGRLKFWHGDWCWGPRYVVPLCLASAPVGWWFWERFQAKPARLVLGSIAIAVLVGLQAVPMMGLPIGSHFTNTVEPLARAGALTTTNIYAPPVPEDNRVLYFRPANSMIVSVVRGLQQELEDPRYFAGVCLAAVRAAVAPLIACAAILVATRRERSGPPVIREAA